MGEIPRADPAASPRIGLGSVAKRERPIVSSVAGHRSALVEGEPAWKVEVIPLAGDAGAAGDGRALEGGDTQGRTTFEVRAEFDGAQLAAFEFNRAAKVRRVETWGTRDRELAVAVARRLLEQLRAGEDDLFIPDVATAMERRA